MRTFTATIVGLLLSLTLSPAFAEAGATGGPTASPPGASAYFVDLKDGATIGPTTTIHFGLHGMGVAPAGSDKANSGHHHLLIDTDLPPLDQPIPNDENHIHFGAGQTEVDLTLTPGPHTLQLLLGDKDHIPHSPPVMSPPIHVNVAASGAPSPPGAAAYFVDLKDGATIGPTTTIHFGLHGMGVAPAGSDKANSGHHHLLIDTDLPPLDQPIPNDENHMHFGAGQTEVDLTLTPGPHTLQLLLGDKNHVPHSPPVMSPRIHVDVAAAAPAPPPAATDAPSSAGGAGPVEQTPAKTSPPGAPPAATGAPLVGSTHFAARRQRVYRFAGRWGLRPEDVYDQIRPRQYGPRARWGRKGKFWPSSSFDRRAAARSGPADSERRKSSALRRRSDRGDDYADARSPYTATIARRRPARSP